MVDFALADEQRQLQQLAREFAQNEIVPVAGELDRNGEFPWDVARKAFDLGLLNLHLPPDLGGLGLSVLDEVIINEEIAAGCTGIATCLGINGLASTPVLLAGTDEQKREFLAPLTRELMFCSYAVTEPGAGSDVAGIQTTARKVGDEYVINGTKRFITAGGVAQWYVVFAYTDKSKHHDGISAFLVWRDTPGISVPRKEDMMGQRASNTAEVVFEDVVVPAKNLLGREGMGFKIAMGTFDRTRPGVAVMAVGLARAAMEHAISYAKQRQTFGQPIASYQGISFMLADMAMKVAAARHLCWHAAWLIDQGVRNTKEASFAKAFGADMAMETAVNAVQVLGGYGFSKEYPCEKLMRDAKVIQIYEGTSQIQRLIIARHILGM